MYLGACKFHEAIIEHMELDNLRTVKENGPFRGKCYECPKYGHRAIECLKYKQRNEEGQ